MTALGILWFVLLAVLICGYFVLDGFDLGCGVLCPLIAKDERERAFVRRAIGPVWDGNEVWLLTAGGAMFAAFAPAYATSFSGFYLAIMLVLFALIVRACSLEFRAHDHGAWVKVWDWMFIIGSFLPALLFGVAAGNVIEGIPLNDSGDYTGTFFQLLNPFAPHMTEELWEKLGHSHNEQLAYYPWPKYEEAKCVEATVEIAVQVNGKVKARLKVPADITSEDAIAAAKADPAVAAALEGKQRVKEIYVKGRLGNLAVKG